MEARFTYSPTDATPKVVRDILIAASEAMRKYPDHSARAFLAHRLAHLDLDKMPAGMTVWDGQTIINTFNNWIAEIDARADAQVAA